MLADVQFLKAEVIRDGHVRLLRMILSHMPGQRTSRMLNPNFPGQEAAVMLLQGRLRQLLNLQHRIQNLVRGKLGETLQLVTRIPMIAPTGMLATLWRASVCHRKHSADVYSGCYICGGTIPVLPS